MDKEIQFETGDLILFHGSGLISGLISWATGSSYTHIAMILKDPTYIDENLKGLYIIEANYSVYKDKKNYHEHPLLPPEITSKTISNGVQIVPLEDIFKRNQSLYYRKLTCIRDDKFNEKIYELHKHIHHHPYDLNIFDWLEAEINIITEKINNLRKDYEEKIPLLKENRTDKFWCSALIGYIYVKLGFLNHDMYWTLLNPKNFSDSDSELNFINCTLDKDLYLPPSSYFDTITEKMNIKIE